LRMREVTAFSRSIPKVDAHHHLWELGDGKYEWLVGGVWYCDGGVCTDNETQKHFLGDLNPIARNYFLEDYFEDTKNQNVVKVCALWRMAR